MTNTELNALATQLYPHWVAERESFIRDILTESDWEYFQLFGIGERLVNVDGQILPDLTDNEIFADWDCGNYGQLLYALYQIAYDFAEFVAVRLAS